MVALLLLAGVLLRPVEAGDKVRDLCIADLDADGHEDLVAVTKHRLLLWRSGRAPAIERAAAPLTVLGRGLCGVVRRGRYHQVTDPFGAWREGPPQGASLLAALGRAKPALLVSPGDLDGDGKDDPILAGPKGFFTPQGRLPVLPRSRLTIERNESFGVEYRIPAPVIGNWSGAGKELVFFLDGEIASYRGLRRSDLVPLHLPEHGRQAESIRRSQVFLRDIDGDGRLDLLVVVAKGSTRLFAPFEATARFFRGGRIYSHAQGGFYRPTSFLKVSGALLRPALLDLDSDGDLDLVLSTVSTSLLAAASGSAPGTYHLFRFDKRAYARKPVWTFRGPVPLAAFSERPRPPVRFLPDLDGNGRPEALVLGAGVALYAADRAGRFRPKARLDLKNPGRVSIGRRMAAVACGTSIALAEAAR